MRNFKFLENIKDLIKNVNTVHGINEKIITFLNFLTVLSNNDKFFKLVT